MPKMSDVAKAAGVSKSTVSNVMNNPYLVSEEKYTKVVKAIHELNYTPNQNASKLRSSRKSAVAIIVPELTFFYAELAEKIITQMSTKDYSCFIWLSYYNEKIEEELLTKCQTSGISGVFIWSCGKNSAALMEQLLDKSIPVILVGSDSASIRITSVCCDVYGEAYRSAKRAISGIYKPDAALNTLMVSGSAAMDDQTQCLSGFRDALGEAHIPFHSISIRMSPEFACIDFLNAILAENLAQMPDVIFCTSVSAAAGLRQAVEYLSISPEIVCLGTDKWYGESNSNPYGAKIDYGKIGQYSANLMIEYLKTPKFFEPRHIVLDRLDTNVWTKQTFPCFKSKRIRLTLYNRPWADVIQKLIPLFEKDTGISVECECMPDSMSLMERVRHLKKHENDKMDVFVLPHYCLKYFNNDEYTLCLNDYLGQENICLADEYPPEIQRVGGMDFNDIHAIPLTFNTQLLFFRKDLFERDDIRRKYYRRYGIELAPPRTWTDFDVISHFFTREFNPDSPVPYGTTFVMSSRASLVEEFYPRQWAYNGRIISKASGRPVLNSTQNLMALENMYRAYECTPKTETTKRTDDHSLRILSNDIAMHNTYATYIPNNMGIGTIDYQRIGCTVTPGGKPLLSGWMLCISSGSGNKDEAYAFIRWITQKRFAELNAFLGLFNPQNTLLDNIHCQNIFPWTGSFLSDITKAGLQEGMITQTGEIVYPRTIVELIHRGLYKALTEHIPAGKALEEMNGTLERIYCNGLSES